MLLGEVEEHIAYWNEFPPPHISLRMLAQAMAGWKPPPKLKLQAGTLKPSSKEDVAAFIAAVTGG